MCLRDRYLTPRGFAAIEDAGAVDLDFGDGIFGRVEIVPATASRFTFTFTTSSAKGGPFVVLTRVRVRTHGGEKEGFYGLGEQQDAVDSRGKLRAMQIEADGEIESANNEAHVPVPFVIGTSGWAMFVASTRVGTFDVARKDPSSVEATFAEPALRFELISGHGMPPRRLELRGHGRGKRRLRTGARVDQIAVITLWHHRGWRRVDRGTARRDDQRGIRNQEPGLGQVCLPRVSAS